MGSRQIQKGFLCWLTKTTKCSPCLFDAYLEISQCLWIYEVHGKEVTKRWRDTRFIRQYDVVKKKLEKEPDDLSLRPFYHWASHA